MGGSQLAQLKAALHSAGLSRTPSSSINGSKKGKKQQQGQGKTRSGGSIRDPEARQKKLQAISDSLNAFDVKTTKTKHQILGAKPAKGSTGRPGLSRQVGIETRKKTLLPEWLDRNRTGGVLDRRFGENDPTMTPEEKALQRFTIERQRKASKSSLFNLNDEDNDGEAETMLTHYGQSLADARQPLPDQEDFFKRATTITSRSLPGNEAAGDEDSLLPARKRTKAEIMQEVMAKSKAYKFERQKVRSEDDDLRQALDEELESIRDLLGAPNSRQEKRSQIVAGKSELANSAGFKDAAVEHGQDNDTEDGGESDEVSEDGGSHADSDEQDSEDGDTESEVLESDESDTEENDRVSTVVGSRTTGSVLSNSPKLTFIPARKDDVVADRVDRTLLAKLLGKERDTDNDKDEQEGDGQEEPIAGPSNAAVTANQGNGFDDTASVDNGDDDPYDRFVRELAFDKRAQPSDRMKTAVEIAREAAEQLELSERARLKRMRGEYAADESNASDNEGASRKRRKGQGRAPQGDDLDDEFALDGDNLNGYGLGTGLRADGLLSALEDEGDVSGADQNQNEGHADDDVADSDADEDDLYDDKLADDEEATGSEAEEDAMLADLLHGQDQDAAVDSQSDFTGSGSDEAENAVTKPTSTVKPKATAERTELPYTFPCPTSHEDFLDLVSGLRPSDVATVIERTRTLYHPSLGEGNKEKLATFTTVLIDHIIYAVSQSDGSFVSAEPILLHVISLVPSFPLTTSRYFVDKLTVMQKNLTRGLAAGPLESSSRTWPRMSELTVLRLIGLFSSTSDFSHPVAAPAMLLMCQYLGQCRIRSFSDIVSGAFLVSLIQQYEEQSKRFVPEALTFIVQSISILAGIDEATTVRTTELYHTPDIGRPELAYLKIQSAEVAQNEQTLDLLPALRTAEVGDSLKTSLLMALLQGLDQFVTIYSSLPAAIELFRPIHSKLAGLEQLINLPATVRTKLGASAQTMARTLSIASKARRPLMLQAHKPIPIRTYLPKFEDGYAPGRHFDPDSERNETQKLQALVRKEKKGAIRELRKDNRFLANEKSKMQREKDDHYRSRMNRAHASLELERADEKRFERTKETERKRDKRRASGGRGGKR